MTTELRPKFVEFIPQTPEDGVLYISREYATAVHLCCCGCGQKVVTPLSPLGWRMTVSGDRVTLSPSIGNWGFQCRSHYWIRRNRVRWSYQMSDDQIGQVRSRHKRDVDEYIRANTELSTASGEPRVPRSETERRGFWRRVLARLFG